MPIQTRIILIALLFCLNLGLILWPQHWLSAETASIKVLDDDIPLMETRSNLREMNPIESSHWISMIYSTEKRLEIQMKRKQSTESELFDEKRRLNKLVNMSLKYYKEFPNDLDHDLRNLLNRIDRAIVKLREPKYVAIVEVPLYGDQEEKVALKKKHRPFQFIWPVTRIRITSPFGMRRDPYTQKPRFHSGTDLGGKEGTLVYSAERGRVIFVGYRRKAGKIVVIEHTGGYTTVYAHLNAFLTVRGLVVERGQPIGLIGRTGRSTGPHLHFEIRYNGKALDPDKYVGQVLGN